MAEQHARDVLVVSSDPAESAALEKLLEGFECVFAASVEQVAAVAAQRAFAVALVDELLADGSGLDAARTLLERAPTTRVVMMTARPSLGSAREAMRAGVVDYLEKPFSDPGVAVQAIERAERMHDLEEEKRRLTAELVERNQRLEELSVRDPLTGLFNHGYLQHALESELKRSRRFGARFSLLLVDVDRFREHNEARGHEEGDRLLVELASILDADSRSYDLRFRLEEGDVLARYGADLFALLLPEAGKAGAARKAERIREKIEAGGEEAATVSIGIASFPDDGDDRGVLLGALERALLAAKRQGGNCVVSHTPELAARQSEVEATARRAAARARRLRTAIADADFDFAYQPIVGVARPETPFAYEALVRPRDRESFPHPGILIDTASSSGQIISLGRVLRRLAVRGLERMPDDAIVFVNLHPDELDDVDDLLADETVRRNARRVVLEITEVAGIRDYARMRATIAHLQGAGFRVALDDLGAGYSGLNALAMLEPDFVKLDMALVHSIAASPRSRRLAQHILEFAQDEGMTVVAEGIEERSQFDALCDLGCPLFQGFFFGRPGPLAG